MTLEESPLSANEIYDANYYACNLGITYERNEHWLEFFGRIAGRIVADLEPKTVLDVGCAFGFLVEALRDRDVDARGFDISEYAISQAAGSAVGHCEVGSATEPFAGWYDLVTTVEMIEHLDAEDGRLALANMAAVTDRILISTTPFDHTEASHVNVQPAEYWAEMMASVGFYRDQSYDASYLTDWAALYVRGNPTQRDLILNYERSESRIRIERNELRREVLRLDAVVGELRTEIANADLNVVAALEAEVAGLVREVASLKVEHKMQLMRASDAVQAAEAERATGQAVNRLLQEKVSNLESTGSQRVAADGSAAIARLAAVEQSTTWRLMWKVLAPWRWLRSRP